MLDIRGYKLQRKFGLSAEQAQALVAAGIDNPVKVRASTQKALKDAGLSDAKAKAVKGIKNKGK